MKKLLFYAVMALFPVLCCAQQYVELSKNAPIYKSAKIAGVKLDVDPESVFLGFFTKGQVLFPFAQQVVSSKGNWMQLPLGWVQKKYTTPVVEKPIPESVFSKHYEGTLMDPSIKKKKGNDGLAINYDFYCVKTSDNSDEVLVFVALFWERKIVCTAKLINNNLIQCDKFIMTRDAEYEEGLENLYFSLKRERHGMKEYKLFYGDHLKTLFTQRMGDDEYEVKGFDMEKMTSKDYKLMYDQIQKLGNPTKLAISARTFENLKEAKYE